MAREVGVGFRIKTGRAIAVVGYADSASFNLIDRREISLTDADVRESSQPYHAGLDKEPDEAKPIVARACDVVRAAALVSVSAYLDQLDVRPRRAGLVVNSIHDPSTIKNDHIRAHAMEGRLFREVVADALERNGIDVFNVIEADCYRDTALAIDATEADIRSQVAAIKSRAGTPWRADEKAACAAAWIAAAG
jgi:hypothetical protein